MSEIKPLSIRIFNKDFVKIGDIGAPKFVTVHPRHNRPGSATISLLANDPNVVKMASNGARVRIHDEFGNHLISGRVVVQRSKGPKYESTVEFDVLDSFDDVFNGVLGWVVPGNPITSQGTAGTNWTLTDDAETVIKTAVQANAIDRLGLPVVCATNLHRGADITAKLRFDPLFELFPVVDGAGADAAGIGVTVKHVGPGDGIDDYLEVDVYEPAPAVRTLTEESGVVWDYSFVRRAPTATRAVIGGAGEGTLRLLRERIAADGRETDIGWIIERFRDARDTSDPDTMYERADQTLLEGAAKASLSVTLSQTPNFRYGKHIRVGDTVAIAVSGVVAVTDVLTEATLSWTADDGWKATPKIGDIDDSTDAKVLRLLSQLTRELARQRRT